MRQTSKSEVKKYVAYDLTGRVITATLNKLALTKNEDPEVTIKGYKRIVSSIKKRTF